jgi:hypothetical protein
VQNRIQLNLGEFYKRVSSSLKTIQILYKALPKTREGFKTSVSRGSGQGVSESPSLPSRRHSNFLKDPLNCECILIFSEVDFFEISGGSAFQKFLVG